MTIRRAVVVLALALTVPSRRATAQTAADVSAARDLFIQGSELVQQGKWDEARERYERSLRLKRAAITLYSLGLAQKNTGRLVEALENMRAFLAEPSAEATRPYEKPAQQAIAELEKRVARIELHVEPARLSGIAVTIDGQAVPAAALGVPRLVNPGPHEVAATAPGYSAARASETVAEGAQATVKLSLEKMAEPAALPKAPGAARRSSAGDAALRPSRALPFALIGGGAAGLGAGAIVGLFGVSQASDAPTRDGPEADAARTKMHVGDVLGGLGVVAAGVGVVLLLTRPSARAPASARATPAPRIGSSVVALCRRGPSMSSAPMADRRRATERK